MERVVVVIGGGMAGVSVAYELAEHASVVLLEAEPSLALHTTGRSAAAYEPSYGPPVIRTLTLASGPRFAELAARLDTPPLLTSRPTLWLGCDDAGVAELAALCDAGAAEPITIDHATRLCPALAPAAIRTAGVDNTSADLDVMALHQGYVRGLVARGGTIHSGHPVTAVERAGSGWTVLAGDRTVTADVVVDAAGAWADRVAALADVAPIGITPLRRTIAIAAGSGAVDPGWPLVVDAVESFYFRPEGGRVLISPADETPTEPGDAKPVDLDIALAIERVNEVTTLGLRSVHTAWAGLRSFVDDRLPVVGAWPDQPGFVFFAGQGGYGIQTAPALAAYGAAVALGLDVPTDIDLAATRLAPR